MASVPSVIVLVEHRVVPGEVLAGTEIPGGWGVGRGELNLTLRCHLHNDL